MQYKPNIPPTLLDQLSNHDVGAYENNFNNFSLKSGVPVRVYEIDDPQNVSKLGPEYDVVTIEQKNNQGSTTVTYKNCLALDGLGGIADYFVKKFRTPTDEKYQSTVDGFKQEGSFVLLFCMDGNAEKAIILGGLRHPARKDILTKESGHHAEGEFNGLNWQINKDGELRIEFKSSTDNKGNPSDTAAGGSFLLFKKDGSVIIEDGAGEKFHLHKDTKSASLQADKDIEFTAGENLNVKAGKDAKFEIGNDLLIEASGNATIMVEKDVDITVTKNVTFKTKLLKVESDTNIQMQASQIVDVKGDKIFLGRMSTSSMILSTQSIFINSPSISLGAAAQPAVTMSTVFLGIGNLGLPVISTAIGPFSSTVFIG